MADHWAMGGEGAADVARAVVKIIDRARPSSSCSIPTTCRCSRRSAPSRKEIYRAKDATADKAVRDQLAAFEAHGLRQGAGLHRQDAVQLLDQR